MITPELKEKLAKVYELVKRGTDGERAAAQKALDRLLSKHNLESINLEAIDTTRYVFKYSSQIEIQLFTRLLKKMVDDKGLARASLYRDLRKGREMSLELTYLNYVTMQCAYEYFRKHMKAQWVKLCASEIKRKRKAKTKNSRRGELQELFFTQYAIVSNLIGDDELTEVSIADMSEQELKDRRKLEGIEGGKYNRQMTSGLLLGQ